MVDRDKNGVEDSLDAYRKKLAKGRTNAPSFANGNGYAASRSDGKIYNPSGDNTKGQEGFGAFLGAIGNGFTDITRRLLNASDSANRWWTGKPQAAYGAGMGDAIYGAERSYGSQSGSRSRSGGGSWDAPTQDAGVGTPTFADYLALAQQFMGPASQIPSVNYDPQRATLRGNAAENDARLEAMYRQLRGSIDADAPVIQKAYDDALASTKGNSVAAQQQTQAATDAAYARNNEVLANLGIEQAQGNIIQNGTDLASQTARQVADQATRGQAAADRLTSDQATALTHNTNIGNAAGLEGNLQRAANQAKLQALLADIDMQEQEQNAQISAQNASNSRSGFSDQLGLAQWLLGTDTDERRYQDELQMQAAEAAGGQSLPDLGQMLQALGKDASWLGDNPGDAARLLDVLRKFSVVQ